MTAKEKAEELIDKFSERTRMLDPYDGWIEHVISYKAKGHALTAVNEIIEQCYNNGINYRPLPGTAPWAIKPAQIPYNPLNGAFVTADDGTEYY